MHALNKPAGVIHGDRRARRRFPLRAPMLFRARSRTGSGTLLDISYNGVAFTGSPRLAPGERFTAVVALPALRDSMPVELILRCRMVREEAGRMAARITARRFHSTEATAKSLAAGSRDPSWHGR
jgi:hypothetical protein